MSPLLLVPSGSACVRQREGKAELRVLVTWPVHSTATDVPLHLAGTAKQQRCDSLLDVIGSEDVRRDLGEELQQH